MLSVQHFAGAVTEDPGELLDQANEARDRIENFWTELTPRLDNSVTVYPAETVLWVNGDPPQYIPVSVPTPMTMGNGGDPLPWVVQGIITLRDGSALRSGRGRIFVPYFTENDNTEGVPSATALAAMNSAADQLADPVGSTPLNLVLYHRSTGLATNVGVAAAQNKWAYLSSRRD